ncbi:hypothetical protein NL317_29790, partial [Klebsiella pneumoniae]|nr:hypothetical protein [Klebsiella pneumoniae]
MSVMPAASTTQPVHSQRGTLDVLGALAFVSLLVFAAAGLAGSVPVPLADLPQAFISLVAGEPSD